MEFDQRVTKREGFSSRGAHLSSIYTQASAVLYGYGSDIINHSRRREHVEKHHIGAGNKVKLNFRRREKMNSGDASKSENKAKPA